jgi:hypothetical protein
MENHPSEEAKYEKNGESGRSTVTRGGKQNKTAEKTRAGWGQDLMSDGGIRKQIGEN